jgi:hypothetical protein
VSGCSSALVFGKMRPEREMRVSPEIDRSGIKAGEEFSTRGC